MYAQAPARIKCWGDTSLICYISECGTESYRCASLTPTVPIIFACSSQYPAMNVSLAVTLTPYHNWSKTSGTLPSPPASIVEPSTIEPSTGTTITPLKRLQIDLGEQSQILWQLASFVNSQLSSSAITTDSPCLQLGSPIVRVTTSGMQTIDNGFCIRREDSCNGCEIMWRSRIEDNIS